MSTDLSMKRYGNQILRRERKIANKNKKKWKEFNGTINTLIKLAASEQ